MTEPRIQTPKANAENGLKHAQSPAQSPTAFNKDGHNEGQTDFLGNKQNTPDQQAEWESHIQGLKAQKTTGSNPEIVNIQTVEILDSKTLIQDNLIQDSLIQDNFIQDTLSNKTSMDISATFDPERSLPVQFTAQQVLQANTAKIHNTDDFQNTSKILLGEADLDKNDLTQQLNTSAETVQFVEAQLSDLQLDRIVVDIKNGTRRLVESPRSTDLDSLHFDNMTAFSENAKTIQDVRQNSEQKTETEITLKTAINPHLLGENNARENNANVTQTLSSNLDDMNRSANDKQIATQVATMSELGKNIEPTETNPQNESFIAEDILVEKAVSEKIMVEKSIRDPLSLENSDLLDQKIARQMRATELATSLANFTVPKGEALTLTESAILSLQAPNQTALQSVTPLTPPPNTTALGPNTVTIVSEALLLAKETAKGVTVQLDPPEMGRVFIEFIFEGDRPVNIVIRTETADAQQMLRERSDDFLAMLKENGLDDTNLSFEFHDDSSAEGFESDSNAKPIEAFLGEEDALQFQNPSVSKSNYAQTLTYSDGLDLRL